MDPAQDLHFEGESASSFIVVGTYVVSYEKADWVAHSIGNLVQKSNYANLNDHNCCLFLEEQPCYYGENLKSENLCYLHHWISQAQPAVIFQGLVGKVYKVIQWSHYIQLICFVCIKQEIEEESDRSGYTDCIGA